MFLRDSKFILIALIICFVGISLANPEGDDDKETSSEGDKDSPKEKMAEEKSEKSKEKPDEELKKNENEDSTETLLVPKNSEDEKEEKNDEEKEKQEETEEKPAETDEKPVETDEKPVETDEKPDESDEKPDEIMEKEEDEPKNEVPEDKTESTPAGPVVYTGDTPIEKDTAPEDTFVVWNKEKICLLAKFQATFSITYSSHRGEEKAEVKIPKSANSKGKCGSNAGLPMIKLSWAKYAFTMMFNKSDEEKWAVISMELTYDTSEPLFDDAVNAGKKTARSKAISLFETPLKNSYFCPGQEIIHLFAGNKEAVVVRIRELQLQPYEIENGEFSPIKRCDQVVIDEETPYVQDETVPFAVGCTLALITLIILVGFSIHRAYHAAKVDYNSME